jgi:hypothetical protein
MKIVEILAANDDPRFYKQGAILVEDTRFLEIYPEGARKIWKHVKEV